MRSLAKIPEWINFHQFKYESIHQVPANVLNEINDRLVTVQSDRPLVSIVIPAWNEEINIINCVSSLSCIQTNIPFEILVVDNNSTDKTHETLKKLNIRSLSQPIQGCGPARQLGQENAKGKYILLADADCLYPPLWMDEMMVGLKKEDTVCVYGRYSFLPTSRYPRWKLYILETLKDTISELRHIKRPYLNAYGMSMGYIRAYGMEVGFVDHNIRGEDGRLCFDLMRFGKIKQIKSRRARVWTPPRTLQQEGGVTKVLSGRIKKELKRFHQMFTTMRPHDTKTSKN